MREHSGLGGLDWFRILAALLVVAVHTGPLLSYQAELNYALTDILARLAVPFFFAVTGYFLVPKIQSCGMVVLLPMAKKIALLYGISTLLYLPARLLGSSVQETLASLLFINNILFNGTYYHLWYFPAILIGAYLAGQLLMHLGGKAAFTLCCCLYIIGLFGDSYYGLVPASLQGFYKVLFLCFDQTRNGLFFPPLFLLIGGFLASHKAKHSVLWYAAALCTSLALLLIEGHFVKAFRLARFDTMYLLLPFCIYFLIRRLTCLHIASKSGLRTLATTVYILHPLCIIGIRGVARLAGLSWLFVDNSLVYYLVVCLCSFAAALPFQRLCKKKCIPGRARAWIELDSAALQHNIEVLTGLMPAKCSLMAVVKANAYGHGQEQISRLCMNAGINAFAVATAREGAQLRKHGITGEILVLGYTAEQDAPLLYHYHLTQAVVSLEHAQLLNQLKHSIRVHIKLDTGMHRLGIPFHDFSALVAVYACKKLKVTGVFTHFADSEALSERAVQQTQDQASRFYSAIEQLKAAGYPVGTVHIQSTYGLLNYNLPCNYVRIGIALYGLLSSPQDQTRSQPDLKPVLSLRARIAQIHFLQPGEPAGYSNAFTAEKPSVIAVVTLGYADGYPRNLSNGAGRALVHGACAPVVGLICMDQLLVDVTNIPNTAVGDLVTFIGQDEAAEITAGQIAQAAGTITNELLSRLGPRLERFVV